MLFLATIRLIAVGDVKLPVVLCSTPDAAMCVLNKLYYADIVCVLFQ